MDKHIGKFLVKPGEKLSLKHHDPGYIDGFDSEQSALEQLNEDIAHMRHLQEKMYAQNRHSLLIILQALDAAGKDSAIAHVMTGLNPQGCQVHSFKHPTDEEYDHDFLWRHYRALPERGNIGIFNRSYYENVLICKVHPELVMAERIPGIDSVKKVDADFWEKRYKQISHFEKTIIQSGTTILKFFLNVSKQEQRNRFLERIDNPEKHWKFSFADINERNYWKQYHKAYEDALSATSSKQAPWYVIPADSKWYTRVAISSIIVKTLKEMKMQYPDLAPEEKQKLADAKAMLLKEKR